MADLNKVIIKGRLTADPELRMLNNGTPTTTFTVAVNRYTKEGDKADFPTVVAWREAASAICKYFTKGKPIIIVGSLQTRSWADKYGNKHYATEVVVDEFYFCEIKKASEGNASTANEPSAQGYLSPRGGYVPDAYTGSPYTADVDDTLPY